MYHFKRPHWHAIESDEADVGNLYHRVCGWLRRRRSDRADAGGPVPQLCPPWRTWKELGVEEPMSYKYSDREREQMRELDDAINQGERIEGRADEGFNPRAAWRREAMMERDRTVTTTGSSAAAAEVIFAELFARVQRGELTLTGCEIERRPFDETIVMTVKLKPSLAPQSVASPPDAVVPDDLDWYELDGVRYPQYRKMERPKPPKKPERKPLLNGARELDLE